MQIVDATVLPPGVCFITGTDRGPFVDTFIDIADDTPMGRVYLSRAAVLELAHEFGALPPEQAERERARADAAEQRASAAERRLATFEHLCDALALVGWTPPPADDLEPEKELVG